MSSVSVERPASLGVLSHYIGGEWIPSTGAQLPNVNPADLADVIRYVGLPADEPTEQPQAAEAATEL